MGGSASNPYEVTLFLWEAKLEGLINVQVDVTPRLVFSDTVLDKTVRVVLENSTTNEEYCTGTFNGWASNEAPDWTTIGCNFTGVVPKGDILKVKATSTEGATLAASEVDDDGLRIGIGATFNVIQFALPKVKSHKPSPPPYHEDDYYYQKPAHKPDIYRPGKPHCHHCSPFSDKKPSHDYRYYAPAYSSAKRERDCEATNSCE